LSIFINKNKTMVDITKLIEQLERLSGKKVELVEKEFSTKRREELAKKGWALPDGSFPIENTRDLANAIKAYGLAKNQARAKAHIKKRAKALGAEDQLPKDWK
jgi:hypothetical protein